MYFDIKTEEWKDVKITNPPKPRAAHTCTKINENQVIIYGGRTLESRTNDLFVLDLNDFICSKK